MEEIFMKRLQQMIHHIELLKNTAVEQISVPVLDNENFKKAEGTCLKLETFISKFNNELNNYFRISNDPNPDEVSRFTTIQLQAEEAHIELSLKLKNQKPTSSNTQRTSSKLPKLDLPTFDGNILHWQQFWDQYNANIHERDLPEVDKLLYLKNSLQGPAKKTVDGLLSTSKNYQVAITTLKQRYGKQSQIIDCHYSALSKITPANTTIPDCRRVLDDVELHLRVLESLGENINHNHLRYLVLEKFPEEFIYELKTKSDASSMEDIRAKLENIITAREEASRLVLERNNLKPDSYTVEALHTTQEKGTYAIKPLFPRGQRGFNKRKQTSQSENQQFKKRRLACIFCNEDHFNDECVKSNTIKSRSDKLKDHCFKCFRKGHWAKDCSNKTACAHCKGQHNRALCPKKFPSGKESVTNLHVNTKSKIVLQTAIFKAMKEPNNATHLRCRALLDSGSQRSYITEKVAKKLKLTVVETSRLSVFAFGADAPREYDSSLVKIHLKSRNDTNMTIYAYVVPMIAQHVPCPNEEITNLQRDLLADDGSLGDQIDILIGNDYYFSIISINKITVKENLYLVDSELGWILTGQLTPVEYEHELKVITYFQSNVPPKLDKPDLPLDKTSLKTLWDLEAIGITDSPKLNREEEAIRNFNETTQFVNGRYSICWPWKEYPPNLPTNFGMAFGRLTNLVKRLDSKSLHEYDDALKYQLKNGIIEVVVNTDHASNNPAPVHYLPHHGVQCPGKPVRIVYDASAKIKDSNSLNDCLYCGPSLVEDLTALIIRFRRHRVGLTADVEKAFLQISIQDKDRDVTRFLWVRDTTKPVTKDNLLIMRFCRVPFGIISSPFLLNATIKHHLSKTKLKDIVDDIYVDNLVTGTDTATGALQLNKESKDIFQDISMNLRSWSSNSKKFMEQALDTCEKETVQMLGLDWHLQEDTIQLRSKEFREARTKREVLRNIAQVFDPCGFAAPGVLSAKLFLQDLWMKKSVKWDSTLSPNLALEWKNINTELEETSEIKVARHFISSLQDGNNQLHCFTDASTKAYAATIYIVNGEGKAFVMGKSRLVPIKDREDLKIPRLELLGATIGNRLLKYTEKSLQMEINQQFLWTDSQIVIDWFNSGKLLPPFVARRIKEIKDNGKLIVRYVPTELNPADIGTRTGKTKTERSYWLKGPDFLLQDSKTWPTNRLKELSYLAGEGLSETEKEKTSKSEDTKERKTQVQYEKQQVENGCNEVNRESQCDLRDTTIDRSNIEEIKSIQKQHFIDEMTGKATHLTRNLDLFLDGDGLLHSRGRFMNADWAYDKRFPILLPRNSAFTNDLIQNMHEKNYHVGVNHTLSLIRELYWIPQGRSQVGKVLKKCPSCNKHGGGPYRLPSAPALPPERVNYSSPFTYTGLDYLGPVLVDTENGVKKRWICLYTCLTVRAIHLEVVKDMTAEETLLALRRMIAVRGVPTKIISDNAQQFKLTAEVLERPFCVQSNISWRFITNLAPWKGGFYERLVALVKHCLKRTLQKNLLNDSQLLTIIKEIEAVLNTRPLMRVDAEQEYIIKPSDFFAIKNVLTQDATLEELRAEGTVTKRDLIQSWKRGLRILNEFKAIFISRYLPSLRERYRHLPKEPRVTSKLSPIIGQVVQIKGDSPNRHNWKVGKITQLLKSKDGVSRTAQVTVGDTKFIRSVGHLYPLEFDEDDSGLFSNDKESTDLEVSSEQDDRMEVDNSDAGFPSMDLNEDNENSEIENDKLESVEEPEQDISDEQLLGLEQALEDESKDIQELNDQDCTRKSKEITTKVPRAAAVKALEKIREWTQNFATIL